MSYKVGDRVRIISKWPDCVPSGSFAWNFSGGMDKYLDTFMTIMDYQVGSDGSREYRMEEDGGKWHWADYMIEGLAGFSIEDIQCGFLVKHRNGKISVRFPDYFLIVEDGLMRFYSNTEHYDSTLKNDSLADMNIMEVRDPGRLRLDEVNKCWEMAKVIWKRDEDNRKKLTVEEIEKLLGYKVAIVDQEGKESE